MRDKIKASIEEHLKAGNVVTDLGGLVDRIETALKPKGQSFPCEYKGWRIEIKMGHEFKGTRGSTRRSRGYVAINLKSGEVQQFPPSAGNSVGFLTVRQWVDLKNRMESKQEAYMNRARGTVWLLLGPRLSEQLPRFFFVEDDVDPIHCDCGKPKSSDQPMCPPCMGEPDSCSRWRKP